MQHRVLILMGIAAYAGCATKPPAHDVVLDLPVTMQDSCIPLKTNVYAYTLNGQTYWTDGPKEAQVSVPADATTIGVNCEETGSRPAGCENSGFIGIFMSSLKFQVDLHGAPSYELQCRIKGDEMEVLVTKPHQSRLKYVPPRS